MSEPSTVHSLWFIELLLTYYLIFPFALRLERRVGPWPFAVGGLALTVAARAAFVPWSHEALTPLHASNYLWWLAPFRMSEFFIGMSLGHLLATRRDEVAAWMRSGVDTLGLVVLGLALAVTGVVISRQGDPQLIASDVLAQIGLAILMAPLLFKAPGWLEMTAAARALVFLGVVSFTALIVNDMMRYVASFLRYEGVTGPPWWLFLVVVYVPVGTLLAYPLAKVFRLLPSQRTDSAEAPAALAAGGRARRAADARRDAKPVRA